MDLVCFLLLAACRLGQETPLFRTGVSVVRLDVQVVEGNRIVENLESADFTVLDEGSPRTIEYFGRSADPAAVLLLLDASGSMRKHVEQVAAAARAALAQLGPEDEVAVMAFARRAKLRADFTRNHAALARELRSAAQPDEEIGSATLINAAVLEAAGRFTPGKPGPRARRAILILTDNNSMGYKTPDDEVLRALWSSDVVLNAIVTGRGYRPPPPPAGKAVNPDFTPADVFVLAERTGGEVARAEQAGEAFRDMLERIRSRYSLHYRLPADARPGSFRAVRVELTGAARRRHPKAQVRVRQGYYVAE